LCSGLCSPCATGSQKRTSGVRRICAGLHNRHYQAHNERKKVLDICRNFVIIMKAMKGDKDEHKSGDKQRHTGAAL
jgi:t-SNARE complex subunit (syntaxin)